MDIYCMSNSSSYLTGSLMTPNGSALSHTSCGIGCYRVYSNSSSLSSSYQGIYTCRIADSRGISLDVNFGIYPYGYRSSSKDYISFLIRCYNCYQLLCSNPCSDLKCILQSVHSDLYLHHFTCYHCRVDKGRNHTVLWWVSLPALTGGDRQTVFHLWQHSYINWRSSQCCRLLYLHSQQQIRVQ